MQFPDDEDGHKVWLENLSEAEYEVHKAAQRLRKEQDERRLRDRPEGF